MRDGGGLCLRPTKWTLYIRCEDVMARGLESMRGDGDVLRVDEQMAFFIF